VAAGDIRLQTAQGCLRIGPGELGDLSQDSTVVRLRWKTAAGDGAATFLADDDGSQDPRVQAANIVNRIQRLIAG
jgi:hypothetical protein